MTNLVKNGMCTPCSTCRKILIFFLIIKIQVCCTCWHRFDEIVYVNQAYIINNNSLLWDVYRLWIKVKGYNKINYPCVRNSEWNK